MTYELEQAVAETAARLAGEIIAQHYARGQVAVELKADASPVTAADRDASAAIVAMLREQFPGDAVLSEEVPDDGARSTASRVWIVDPLDGTRDFVARTDQFSVHVGLAVDGVAVVGAVYQPVARAMFAARAGGGAWQIVDGVRSRLRVSAVATLAGARVGTSRLFASGRLGAFVSAAGVLAVPMGASTKHVAMAAGGLDACVNLSPGEQEWDTCAPEVVVREAGGAFTDGDGRAFVYNQRDLGHYRGSVASNGVLHAALVSALAPHLREDTR